MPVSDSSQGQIALSGESLSMAERKKKTNKKTHQKQKRREAVTASDGSHRAGEKDRLNKTLFLQD